MIITTILIAIASICNAVMDICSHKFSISIFNDGTGKNKMFWDATISWRNKYIGGNPLNGRVKMNILGFEFNKLVQLTDAFHLFKSLMLFSLIGAIFFYEGMGFNWWQNLIAYIFFGMVWNTTFLLFYKNILIKKIRI